MARLSQHTPFPEAGRALPDASQMWATPESEHQDSVIGSSTAESTAQGALREETQFHCLRSHSPSVGTSRFSRNTQSIQRVLRENAECKDLIGTHHRTSGRLPRLGWVPTPILFIDYVHRSECTFPAHTRDPSPSGKAKPSLARWLSCARVPTVRFVSLFRGLSISHVSSYPLIFKRERRTDVRVNQE